MEKIMALYMMQIKYTLDAIKDIAESGSNREDAVRPLICLLYTSDAADE